MAASGEHHYTTIPRVWRLKCIFQLTDSGPRTHDTAVVSNGRHSLEGRGSTPADTAPPPPRHRTGCLDERGAETPTCERNCP